MAFKLKKSTELLEHQKTGVEFLLEKRSTGLFDEPGLGKSLEILAAICEVKKPALVVCPPTLQENWKHEITKFTELKLDKDISIVPYTMLGKKVTEFSNFGFVAFDEATALKNLDAKRTQKSHYYMQENLPEFFTWATGTPIKNRIPEIYSFLVMLAYYEHVTPNIMVKYPTYYQFCMRFCNVSATPYGSGMKFTGMKNVEELKEYLKPWTIRRLAKDTIKTPDMLNQTIIASYKKDPELAKAYAEFEAGSGCGDNVTAKRDSAISKANFTAEYVESQLEAEMGPVVVFSDHPGAIKIIEGLLKETRKVAAIYQETKMDKRNLIVEEFQAGKYDVILLTIGIGKEGYTLTKSNLVVFNDICWVPEDLNQARKRIDRLSQLRETRCVYIAGSEVDETLIRAITSKRKIIKAVVG